MIKFFEKSFGRSESNKDVRITNSCATGGLRFSFSPNAWEKAFGESKYFIIGYDEDKPNRIYFSKATWENGIKLQCGGKGYNAIADYTAAKKIPEFSRFIGEYTLEYEKTEDMYFIDVKENEQ